MPAAAPNQPVQTARTSASAKSPPPQPRPAQRPSLPELLPGILSGLSQHFDGVECQLSRCPDLRQPPFQLGFGAVGAHLRLQPVGDPNNNTNNNSSAGPADQSLLGVFQGYRVFSDPEPAQGMRITLRNNNPSNSHNWKPVLREALQRKFAGTDSGADWELFCLEVVDDCAQVHLLNNGTPTGRPFALVHLWLFAVAQAAPLLPAARQAAPAPVNGVTNGSVEATVDGTATASAEDKPKKKLVRKVRATNPDGTPKKRVLKKKSPESAAENGTPLPSAAASAEHVVVQEVSEDLSSVAYVVRMGQLPAADGVSLAQEKEISPETVEKSGASASASAAALALSPLAQKLGAQCRAPDLPIVDTTVNGYTKPVADLNCTPSGKASAAEEPLKGSAATPTTSAACALPSDVVNGSSAAPVTPTSTSHSTLLNGSAFSKPDPPTSSAACAQAAGSVCSTPTSSSTKPTSATDSPTSVPTSDSVHTNGVPCSTLNTPALSTAPSSAEAPPTALSAKSAPDPSKVGNGEVNGFNSTSSTSAPLSNGVLANGSLNPSTENSALFSKPHSDPHSDLEDDKSTNLTNSSTPKVNGTTTKSDSELAKSTTSGTEESSRFWSGNGASASAGTAAGVRSAKPSANGECGPRPNGHLLLAERKSSLHTIEEEVPLLLSAAAHCPRPDVGVFSSRPEAMASSSSTVSAPAGLRSPSLSLADPFSSATTISSELTSLVGRNGAGFGGATQRFSAEPESDLSIADDLSFASTLTASEPAPRPAPVRAKSSPLSESNKVRGMRDVPVIALQLVLSTLSYKELAQLRTVHPHWDELCGQLLNSGYFELIHKADILLQECQRRVQAEERFARPLQVLTNLQVHVLNPVDLLRAAMDEGVLCFPYGQILDMAFVLLDRVEQVMNVSEEEGDAVPLNWEKLSVLARRAQVHYRRYVEPEVEKRMSEVTKLTAQQRLQRLDSFLVESSVSKLELKQQESRDELHWEMEQLKEQNKTLKKDNRELKQCCARLEGRVEALERKFKTMARLLQ